jgi:hypothetical protein
MKAATLPGFLIAILLCASATAQHQPKALETGKAPDGLTPSEHRAGPHGLEGWTLKGPLPDGPEDKYPFVLVIARNGREIRRFNGSAFVWKWMFVADGRQVAYESGPLHFSATCILADIETGRELEAYDCWSELPPDAPDWVEALEASKL